MAASHGISVYTVMVNYPAMTGGELPIGFIVHNMGIWTTNGALGVPEYFTVCPSAPLTKGDYTMSTVGSVGEGSTTFNLQTSSSLFDISKIEIAPLYASMFNQ